MSELTSLDGREVFWRANPRQDVALSCPAFEILFGGQKGGGKSDVVIAKPIELIMLAHKIWLETGQRQERCRIVIFRKNLGHLTDLITRAKEIYPKLDPAVGIDGWNKQEKRFVFSSGAFVEFAHLDGPDDHQGYNGQELRGICIDQAEEISFEVVQFLRAQVRTSDPRYADALFVFYTANPGGKHAQWVKDYFIKTCQPNKLITEEVRLSDGRVQKWTKAFIPSALKDNPYLNADGRYEANLRKLPEHMQAMYLAGDWDAVVGAFFAHVLRREIHFINSFPIPDSWEIKGGLDWGSTAPASAHWGTRDEDDSVYIIDELYGPGITGRTFGEKVVKKFANQKWGNRKWSLDDVYFLLDWSSFARNGSDGLSPGDGLIASGLRIFDANKNRASGVEQFLERLQLRPVQVDGETRMLPKLYIFADRCPNLCRTLPMLMASKADPNDIDTDQEDHAYDSVRYLLMDWPVDTRAKPNDADADVARWLRLAKARQREAKVERYLQGGYGS